MSLLNGLKADPIPTLLQTQDPALTYFVRRDLLDEDVEPLSSLNELPGACKIVSRQLPDGSWRYPGKAADDPVMNYVLLETFRQLGVLVTMYGFTSDHQAVQRAASYVFSCQDDDGALVGILGTQYIPYYQGAIWELLIKAGYWDVEQIEKGFKWLLSMRQEDGGWIVPMQAVKPKPPEIWSAAPIPPDRTRPFSHMATGMVLRAFAVHPDYRRSPEARRAGGQLKARFFKADKYNDRKAPAYWIKFQYPFWWTNLLTALDTLSLLSFSAHDPDIQRGLEWFISHQEQDGLWKTGYEKARQKDLRAWVGLAVCRVFKRMEEMMVEEIQVVEAARSDAEEILFLQKLAYQSEAQIYADYTIPPLQQNLTEIAADLQDQVYIIARLDGMIIGSVRGYQKEDTCYIGRLIVHPDYQNKGIGSRLMNAIEQRFKGVARYELFTGEQSQKNLYLYSKLGYQIFRRQRLTDKVTLVYMEKLASSN